MCCGSWYFQMPALLDWPLPCTDLFAGIHSCCLKHAAQLTMLNETVYSITLDSARENNLFSEPPVLLLRLPIPGCLRHQMAMLLDLDLVGKASQVVDRDTVAQT
jgi:hypothetical protein